MTCLFLSHPDCQLHEMGAHHPESPARLKAIEAMVDATDWHGQLLREQAPALASEWLTRVHPQHYIDAIMEASPRSGVIQLDGDTSMNPHSLDAALRAAGSGYHAVDQVLDGAVTNAFCAVRPPGHHAESNLAMGFCLFNNIALAAERALARGLERIAILDFDVHHGNGTVEIFQHRPEVLVCSSFQFPFYPGRFDQVNAPNIVLSPLPAGTDSSGFREAIERDWTPALTAYQPDLLLISAGFDAHASDPLADLMLQDDDYLWISQWIRDQAERYCQGHSVAMLEGGYHLEALARSVKLYMRGQCDG